MVDLEVTEYEAAHRNQVLSIWSDRLGQEYADGAVLADATRPDSGVQCLVAVQASQVIGFATCRLIGPGRVAAKLRRPGLPDWVSCPVGLLDTGAVTRTAEGHGVGKCLLQRLIQWLQSHGAQSLLAISWTREGERDSSRLLAAEGFDHVATEERYWYEESVKEEYSCPDCGHPCRCAAEIWMK